MKRIVANVKRKKFTARLMAFMLSIILVVSVIQTPLVARAASKIYPKPMGNLETGYSSRGLSSMVATSDGYYRIFSDDKYTYVEKYDDSFNIISRKEIPLELPIYGGFYEGANNYFLVYDQNNTEESNTKEVVRVVKYSKDWVKLSSSRILSGTDSFAQVRFPFDLGYPDMAEYNGILYLAMGHEGYVDPAYNQGHQGLCMYAIRESTMQYEMFDYDLWHSFSQDLAIKDSNNIFLLELSEGSRYVKLSKYKSDKTCTSIPILRLGGDRTSAWAIATYASADDVAVSDSYVLSVGSSINQANYDNGENEPWNVYLATTSINQFSEATTSFRWLTSNTSSNENYTNVNITKVNSNRFMISYEKTGTTSESNSLNGLDSHILYYTFVDGSGRQITGTYQTVAPDTNCAPVVKNGKVSYYASDGKNISFYSIDSSTGKATKKAYALAGATATWAFASGKLTVSGSGALYDSFGSSLSNKDSIKEILVKNGITKIGESTFSYFSSLENVVLENGVKEIGSKAFYGMRNLKTITIPNSVTSISEDAFDTGWYWSYDYSPVRAVTIKCYKGSYAEQYAKKIGVSVIYLDEESSGGGSGSGGGSSSGGGSGSGSGSGSGDSSNPNNPKTYTFSGLAHIQTYGDTKGKFRNGILSLGTTGQGKRLEEITINFVNNTGYSGGIQYRVHRQTYGWTGWIDGGKKAGTRGQAKRLEAIQIRLTGELAKHYNVVYRVHAQTYGWNQGWQYNGALAGTEGEAKRLECLEVKLEPKASNTATTGVAYRVHRQTFGWESRYALNGAISGTVGQAKRLEGIEIALTNNEYPGSIVYSTHVQTYGWMKSVSDGMMSGTTGQAKRLEAIKIELTGEMAKHYDIYYRVHAQTYGWLGWAKNGAPAGTAGYAKRLEAIQIVLVKKGGQPPANSYKGAISKTTKPYIMR